MPPRSHRHVSLLRTQTAWGLCCGQNALSGWLQKHALQPRRQRRRRRRRRKTRHQKNQSRLQHQQSHCHNRQFERDSLLQPQNPKQPPPLASKLDTPFGLPAYDDTRHTWRRGTASVLAQRTAPLLPVHYSWLPCQSQQSYGCQQPPQQALPSQAPCSPTHAATLCAAAESECVSGRISAQEQGTGKGVTYGAASNVAVLTHKEWVLGIATARQQRGDLDTNCPHLLDNVARAIRQRLNGGQVLTVVGGRSSSAG